MSSQNDSRTIVSASITREPPVAPGVPPGRNTVWVTLDDATSIKLFSYYTDELTFAASDFTGLTVAEAHRLFFARDLAYLRS